MQFQLCGVGCESFRGTSEVLESHAQSVMVAFFFGLKLQGVAEEL
jgi:hypothetical protein